MFYRLFGIALVGWMTIPATLALAQAGPLESYYNGGVQAYFSGDYFTTFNSMTAAIGAGSKDPLVYYFRGLAELNLARENEADDDFTQGAQLEATDASQYYDVGKGLERIQGGVRLKLEHYRTQARIAAYQLREQQRLQRYQMQAPMAAPPGSAAPGGTLPPPAAVPGVPPAGAPPAKPDNPFGETPKAPPPAEKKPATANPFG
jgi:hypothetical protein